MEDEAIKQLTTLDGVGKSKAKLLYDAGFETIVSIKDAGVGEIAGIKGIGDKLAQRIKKSADESDIGETAEESVKEEKAEVIAVPGITITLDDETKRLMKVRKVQKGKKPNFRRTDSHKKKRVPESWRKPRGMHNKMRIGIRGKCALVQSGYGSPAAVRGLHPSGFEEMLVNNLKDLENIKVETQAARIASTVGMKKRIMMEEKAVELGLKVLNPIRRTS
ncbi:MAG: 50S ribosomal protein L32e [Candidatus Methanoperedenaceae archaeon HGW-Methanoperedenaceae-1]|jgi:large subunit ribosomal protein L32e|nr:MAG: 50S ribosomal protein L32e [Candidatus Methanoperedenaceae archaeon HGW-Methanoperedenaceae-1]